MDVSFDELSLEDQLEELQHKWILCNDIVDLYGQYDVENYIVQLFDKEVINKGKEQKFEDYMKCSNFNTDDLKFTNRIKELVQQKNI